MPKVSRFSSATSWWFSVWIGLSAAAWWVWAQPTALPPPPFPGEWVWGLAGAWTAVGLIAWAVRGRRRRRWAQAQRTLADLHQLRWDEFEQLVAEAYRRQGWNVAETGMGGADGGIDLVLKKGRRTHLAQVKHWRARVGAPVVREQMGLLVHHRADRAIIVALGGFTSEAEAFARGKPMDLVDGPALLRLLQGEGVEPHSFKKLLDTSEVRPAARRAPRAPRCPACHSAMAQRTRRADGIRFWGCSHYPQCSGTRPW